MIEIYIVCACTTDYQNKVFIGGEVNDINLNAQGKQEAERTGIYLNEYRMQTPFDYLVCSPQKHATETAEIIGKYLQLDPNPADEVREKKLGIYSGCEEEVHMNPSILQAKLKHYQGKFEQLEHEMNNVHNEEEQIKIKNEAKMTMEKINTVDKLIKWLDVEKKFYSRYSDPVEIIEKFDKFVSRYTGFNNIETKSDIRTRIKLLIDFFITSGGKKFLVVSHPLYIKKFLEYIMNCCNLPLVIQPGSITYIKFNKIFQTISINNVDHL
jgi:broad specificity phosphatase PhoE